MAYTIIGFIASRDTINQSHSTLGKPVLLPQQFAMLPITSSICNQFNFTEWPLAYLVEEDISPLTLPTQIANWGMDLSRFGKIGYIEAELFGGSGIKAGAVWHKENFVISPFNSNDAINTVLIEIGVEKGEAIDEFAALNLGAYG